MSTYHETEHMQTADRVTRGVLGMVLLEVILLVPGLSPTLIAVLAVAALYAVFTAIIARDPFHVQRTERREAAVSYPRVSHA